MVVIKDVINAFFPKAISTFTEAKLGSFEWNWIMYSIIYFYFCILTIYLFKKKFIIAAITWVILISIRGWLFYYYEHIDGSVPFDLPILTLNVQVMAIGFILSGLAFVITKSRKLFWIKIFGYLNIISGILILKGLLTLQYFQYFALVSAILPTILVINYILEIRNINKETTQDFNDHLIDGLEN